MGFSLPKVICSIILLMASTASYAETNSEDANICRMTDWTGRFIGQFVSDSDGVYFQAAEALGEYVPLSVNAKESLSDWTSKRNIGALIQTVEAYIKTGLEVRLQVNTKNSISTVKAIVETKKYEFRRNGKTLPSTVEVLWKGGFCERLANRADETKDMGFPTLIDYLAVQTLNSLFGISNSDDDSVSKQSMHVGHGGTFFGIPMGADYFELR